MVACTPVLQEQATMDLSQTTHDWQTRLAARTAACDATPFPCISTVPHADLSVDALTMLLDARRATRTLTTIAGVESLLAPTPTIVCSQPYHVPAARST